VAGVAHDAGALYAGGRPLVFDVLLSRVGTAALGLTAGLGIASFLVLSLLRKGGAAAKA
jgi:hypothetical protein